MSKRHEARRFESLTQRDWPSPPIGTTDQQERKNNNLSIEYLNVPLVFVYIECVGDFEHGQVLTIDAPQIVVERLKFEIVKLVVFLGLSQGFIQDFFELKTELICSNVFLLLEPVHFIKKTIIRMTK